MSVGNRSHVMVVERHYSDVERADLALFWRHNENGILLTSFGLFGVWPKSQVLDFFSHSGLTTSNDVETLVSVSFYETLHLRTANWKISCQSDPSETCSNFPEESFDTWTIVQVFPALNICVELSQWPTAAPDVFLVAKHFPPQEFKKNSPSQLGSL